MRINESGILVVSYSEVVPGIISESYFKILKHRGQITASRGGNNRPVEIVYDTLPEKHRALFEESFGNPFELLKTQVFERYLKPQNEARAYYRSYIPGNHQFLPEAHINKYCQQAQWLEVVIAISDMPKDEFKKTGFRNRREAIESLYSHPGFKDSQLPCNYSKLCAKVRDFANISAAEGATRNYGSLVSAKFGNKSANKIGDMQADWLLANYANPALKHNHNSLFKAYNQECKLQGWQPLKNPLSLRHWLDKPEHHKVWFGMKYGTQKGRVEHSYMLRTAMPTMRDSLWYSDGTKLNFYDSETGKATAQYTVYEVIDAYSEVLLGFSIVKGAENFQAQYAAYKMALQTAGHKPYEIRFDNQGGHKKEDAQHFFEKLSRLSIRTMPYNGRSKSIESVFGRLQMQLMSREWFFTGQNISAKKYSSRENREFIVKYQKYLPTAAEIAEIYASVRTEWNEGKENPDGTAKISRVERYLNSINPEAQPLTPLDMVDIFWFQKPDPITYHNHGIVLQFGKNSEGRPNKFEYEVLTGDGLPDMQFRAKYVLAKFIVKYDPDDLSHIRLHEPGTMRFVAVAQPRIVVQRNIQEQKPGEMEMIRALLDVQKQETKSRIERITNLWDDLGISPDEIVANGGKKAKIREKVPVTVGQLEKRDSYLDSGHITDNW